MNKCRYFHTVRQNTVYLLKLCFQSRFNVMGMCSNGSEKCVWGGEQDMKPCREQNSNFKLPSAQPGSEAPDKSVIICHPWGYDSG